MASKAKSGMSAVRMFPEMCVEPPNSYTPGDLFYTSAIRDGKGHAEYHIAVVNDNPFTLQVQHSWQTVGTWTEDHTIASVVDPVSGLNVAEIVAPVTKRYVRAHIVGTILGPNFEVGWYFLPRASGPTTTSGGSGGGSTMTVVGNQQVPYIETETAILGSATFASAFRDCLNYEAYGISIFLQRGAADATLDIYVEHSKDGATNIRQVETISVSLTAANPTFKLDRVYSATRRWYRVRIVNNSANALGATDVLVMLKPIS